MLQSGDQILVSPEELMPKYTLIQ